VLSRDSRNEKKLKALRRAQFALKQRFERIDWEEDVLLPEVNEFKAAARLPELPEETLVDVQIDYEDTREDHAQDPA
jgi:hypothetical protein